MIMSKPSRALTALASTVVIVAASGCATKSYVSKQINVVDHRLNQLQAQGKEALTKQQGAISQLNERLTTTDNRVAAVDTSAQQANSTAGQALQQTQTNASAIETNASAISAHSTELVKLADNFNYSLVESANVTFPTNKWMLSKDAKAALDSLVQKSAATPRSMIEVVGYTDRVGTKAYNLTLSRRRAEAVARYLVNNSVPLKSISLIGLGEEQTPALLAAEVEAFNPNASKQEIRGLARRVRIRLYAPGASSPAASSASLENQQK